MPFNLLGMDGLGRGLASAMNMHDDGPRAFRIRVRQNLDDQFRLMTIPCHRSVGHRTPVRSHRRSIIGGRVVLELSQIGQDGLNYQQVSTSLK